MSLFFLEAEVLLIGVSSFREFGKKVLRFNPRCHCWSAAFHTFFQKRGWALLYLDHRQVIKNRGLQKKT